MTCPKCEAKDGGVAFECVECCLRWLSKMDSEARLINAPVIEKVAGLEQMERVRKAWAKRRNKGS